jgi:hypothetical protein
MRLKEEKESVQKWSLPRYGLIVYLSGWKWQSVMPDTKTFH